MRDILKQIRIACCPMRRLLYVTRLDASRGGFNRLSETLCRNMFEESREKGSIQHKSELFEHEMGSI